MEKTVCEAIGRARHAGMTWDAIARTLGVAETAPDSHALAEAFGDRSRAILEHQLEGAM